MKTIINEYWYLSKAGLLRNSHYIIAITACLMFLFGKYIGIELEILIFILTPIVLMLDFDANKYVISYTLPIGMRRRLHMIHYLTIVHSFLAVMAVNMSLVIAGLGRSFTINCIIFFCNIIGSNLYYFLFCSQEFKKDVLDEDKRQLGYQCMIGGMIGVCIAIRINGGIESPINILVEHMNSMQRIALIGILTVITVVWTKVSMNRLEKVVRDGR